MPFGVVENRRESFDGRANFYKNRTLKKTYYNERMCIGGRGGRLYRNSYGRGADRGGSTRCRDIVDNLSNSEMKAVEGIREITGRNVPFERVDCDDRQALAGRVRPLPVRRGYPFRRVEGCRRVGREAAALLPQQYPVAAQRARPDAGERGTQSCLLVVVHRVRPARSVARHRADAEAAGHVALPATRSRYARIFCRDADGGYCPSCAG